jgi:FMN phosphatase YigB (HAD superfamily)
MYEHIFFDADGTLFDFQAAETWAISTLLSELGVEPTEEAAQTYSRINNGVWLEFEQGLITMEKLKTERFLRFHTYYGVNGDPGHSAARYAQLLSQTYHLYDDAIPVLDALQEAGMPMTLITNGISRVHGKVAGDQRRRLLHRNRHSA